MNDLEHGIRFICNNYEKVLDINTPNQVSLLFNEHIPNTYPMGATNLYACATTLSDPNLHPL